MPLLIVIYFSILPVQILKTPKLKGVLAQVKVGQSYKSFMQTPPNSKKKYEKYEFLLFFPFLLKGDLSKTQ